MRRSPPPTANRQAAPSASKVIHAAVLANLGIATAKFIVAAFSGSAAMFAEGIHSAADTGNELLLLLGQRQSSKPADGRHPFGYGMALYFWALIVALSMFSLGGGLSIYHGIEGLRHPAPLGEAGWNFLVLALAAVFEGYSWNVSRLALNRVRTPGATLWSTVRSATDAAVYTVFIEDTAALAGIAVAALGLGLAQWSGEPRWDPAASILIGLLMVAAGIVLAVETGGLLLGEGMRPAQLHLLRAIVAADPAIESVGALRTMQLGPEEILLNASVQFRRGLPIDRVEEAIVRIESAIALAYPAIKYVYYESAALRAAMGRV